MTTNVLLFIIICDLTLIVWKLCQISTQLYNYYILEQIELGHIEDYLKKGQKHE